VENVDDDTLGQENEIEGRPDFIPRSYYDTNKWHLPSVADNMATISGEGDQSYKMLRKRKQTYI
jgi:hypothetical protein